MGTTGSTIMAPIHRMDMYHDLPPPPPIPLKLKPKTLKKLSQQAVRGPLYLIVPTPHRPPHPSHQMPHPPPPPPHPNRNYAVVHPRQRPIGMPGPNSNGSPSSISDSLNAMSNSISTSATLLDSHHRFRPDKFNMRPRVQQFPWMRNGRSKSPGNWVRHLTSEDDVEEEEEEEGNVNNKTESAESEARANKNGNNNGNNNSRPEYQPSRLVGEIQLSSRVASMTIADVSPRFALKVSPLDCPLKFGCKRYPSIEKYKTSKFRAVRYTLIVDPSRFGAHPLIVSGKNLACLKPS